MAANYALQYTATATSAPFTGRFLAAPEWRALDSESSVLQSPERYLAVESALPESTDAATQRRKRFGVLAARWHRETGMHSNPDVVTRNPAYREIIDTMGDNAIRFILEDLRLHGGDWFLALEEITQVAPNLPTERPSFRNLKEAWVSWGIEHGYIDR